MICRLCPRNCGVDRVNEFGYCGVPENVRVARAALHFMEEPCIGTSGTVFFSGCNLGCCYCQNYTLSHGKYGKDITVERLADIFLELQEKGANNINLVTGVMFVPGILRALDKVKEKLNIPVIYNCGGYEKISTIDALNGYVDIYLTDIKYYDSSMSKKYSDVSDYFEYSSRAFLHMIEQAGKPVFFEGKTVDDEGALLKSGVIARHMVLPGGRKDSIKILEWLGQNAAPDTYLISLMSQYTPCYRSSEYKEINRGITSFEYDSVVEKALELGIINGYMQARESKGTWYTPEFNLEGVEANGK